MHIKFILDKMGREHSSILEQLRTQCAHRVTIENSSETENYVNYLHYVKASTEYVYIS